MISFLLIAGFFWILFSVITDFCKPTQVNVSVTVEAPPVGAMYYVDGKRNWSGEYLRDKAARI